MTNQRYQQAIQWNALFVRIINATHFFNRAPISSRATPAPVGWRSVYCVKRMSKQEFKSVTTALIERSRFSLTIQIEQCKICSQRKASVMYKPCGHLIACEGEKISFSSVDRVHRCFSSLECAGLMKKCFVCRASVDSTISFHELCSISSDHAASKSETANSTSNNVNDAVALARLQQQLQEIREQVHCPICMDRLKNMVFLCGHGVCQNCGDRVQECPICRKAIEKSIILYT